MNKFELINLILLFISIYTVINVIFGISDKRAIKMVKLYGEKRRTLKEKLRILILKYIKVPPSYFERLEPLLKKTDIKMNAKEFYADQIIQIIFWVILFILSLLLKLEMIAVLIIITAVADVLNRQEKIIKMADKYKAMVLIELPQLIQYIVLSINTDQDLINILKKYRRICKEPLLSGIERLLANLETDSFDNALSKFDNYFEMDSIRSLVSGLTKVEQGIDQKTFFFLLEKEIRSEINKYKIKKIRKKPAKYKINSMLVLASFILMIAYPAFMYIYNQIKLFY